MKTLLEVASPSLLNFTEWDAECKEELNTLVTGIQQDSCIFSDVSSFWRPEVRPIVDALSRQPEMAVQVLSGIVKGRKAVTRRAFCHRHQKNCYLSCARTHTAGSSCTAHSAQGLRMGLSDPNVLHFLAWVALRLEVLEGDITLENVPGFPTDVLHELMGEHYFIECITLDPRMLGCLGTNK